MKDFFKYFNIFLNFISLTLLVLFHNDMTLSFSFDLTKEYNILFFTIPLLFFSVFSVLFFDKLNIYIKIFIIFVKALIPGSLVAFYFIAQNLKSLNKDSYVIFDLLHINAKFDLQERINRLALLLEQAGISNENCPEFANIVFLGGVRFKKMSQIQDYANDIIFKLTEKTNDILVKPGVLEKLLAIVSSTEFLTAAISFIVLGTFSLVIYEYNTTKHNYVFKANEQTIEEAGKKQIERTADSLLDAEDKFSTRVNELRRAFQEEGRKKGFKGAELNKYVNESSQPQFILFAEERDQEKLVAFKAGHQIFKDHLLTERSKHLNLNFKDTLSETFKTIYNTIKQWF